MKNFRIVQEVRGVMTRFEPLTAEVLNTATNGEVTLPEVKAALESLGLDLEHVVHDPTRHNLSTFYADYQRGLYLELYLTSEYPQSISQVFTRILPKSGEAVPELDNQDWECFYLRRVPVPMAIYDFQQRYLELPAEQIFSIWYSIHKRIDYSNSMWQPKVLSYVFSLAPAAELPAADEDGLLHVLRVLLLSLIYFYNSGDTLSEADKQILVYFSLLHDLGRTSEDCDDDHGDASVAMIHARGIRVKGIRLSAKEYRIAELMIRLHCRDDQVGFDTIQAAPSLSKEDKERTCHLYRICKDMDGLDRVRFNGLDYRMLWTEYGRRLPLVAGCLLEESLLEAIDSELKIQRDSM